MLFASAFRLRTCLRFNFGTGGIRYCYNTTILQTFPVISVISLNRVYLNSEFARDTGTVCCMRFKTAQTRSLPQQLVRRFDRSYLIVYNRLVAPNCQRWHEYPSCVANQRKSQVRLINSTQEKSNFVYQTLSSLQQTIENMTGPKKSFLDLPQTEAVEQAQIEEILDDICVKRETY